MLTTARGIYIFSPTREALDFFVPRKSSGKSPIFPGPNSRHQNKGTKNNRNNKCWGGNTNFRRQDKSSGVPPDRVGIPWLIAVSRFPSKVATRRLTLATKPAAALAVAVRVRLAGKVGTPSAAAVRAAVHAEAAAASGSASRSPEQLRLLLLLLDVDAMLAVQMQRLQQQQISSE